MITKCNGRQDHKNVLEILNSFSCVDRYVITCDIQSQLFQTCHTWIQPGKDLVFWDLHCDKAYLSYNPMGQFSCVQKLTINLEFMKEPIDLKALSVAAISLEVLNINGKLRSCIEDDDSDTGLSDDPSCVNPNKIPHCFQFPMLRQAHFRNIWNPAYNSFVSKLNRIASGKHHLWPEHLEQIVFAFGCFDRKNREIEMVRDEFNSKILDNNEAFTGTKTIPSLSDESETHLRNTIWLVIWTYVLVTTK